MWVAGSTLVVFGIVSGAWLGWGVATSSSTSPQVTAKPAAPSSEDVTSVAIPGTGVGVQRWVVTWFVDDKGPGLKITGDPEADWTEVRLPH
jgi:hypothetical protein